MSHDPIIKGGQGRDAEDINDSVSLAIGLLIFCMGVMACMGFVYAISLVMEAIR